jgi:hypothetical protein
MTIDLIEVQVLGPQGPAGAVTPLYGQASKMTAGTIAVASQGVYQATGLEASFDSANASGVVLATTNTFGLRNTDSFNKTVSCVRQY